MLCSRSILDSPRRYFVTTPGDPSCAAASADRSSYSSPAWYVGNRSPAYPFSRNLATSQPILNFPLTPPAASSPSLGATSLGAPHSLTCPESPAPDLPCEFPSLVPAHDCADEEEAQQQAESRIAEAAQVRLSRVERQISCHRIHAITSFVVFVLSPVCLSFAYRGQCVQICGPHPRPPLRCCASLSSPTVTNRSAKC